MHEPATYSPEQPAPLLVLLHGDEGNPAKVGSFWRWAGSPRWLEKQVGAVLGRLRVDPAHIHLSGWSGGATYMGMLAAELGPPFTALNLNGGGQPPADPSRCAPCALPVYYLAGDRNPLHSLAVSNRKYYEACGHDVTWDLLPGKDHAGELAALSKQEKALGILDWLNAHSMRCSPSEPAAPQSRIPGGGVDAGTDATLAAGEPSGVRPGGQPETRVRSDAARCGCASTAPTQGHAALVLLLVGASVARRMLRRGSHYLAHSSSGTSFFRSHP